MVDAAAMAEAVTRPTMRFVQIRQPEQSARQALHRVRDPYMGQRTGLINQIRGFLLEFGIPIRQGAGGFKMDLPHILGDEANELPPSMRLLLTDLWNDFKAHEIRIEEITQQIQRSVQYSDTARRLMTIPGIGLLTASALEASAGNGHQFATARLFAAWLGLVPREYSTGGKTTLLGISKRGNTYIRRLLIHGARSCVQTCDRKRHPLGAWITSLEQRMHRNKVIVALANKIARIAWKILIKPGKSIGGRTPDKISVCGKLGSGHLLSLFQLHTLARSSIVSARQLNRRLFSMHCYMQCCRLVFGIRSRQLPSTRYPSDQQQA
jgi:transposase